MMNTLVLIENDLVFDLIIMKGCVNSFPLQTPQREHHRRECVFMLTIGYYVKSGADWCAVRWPATYLCTACNFDNDDNHLLR